VITSFPVLTFFLPFSLRHVSFTVSGLPFMNAPLPDLQLKSRGQTAPLHMNPPTAVFVTFSLFFDFMRAFPAVWKQRPFLFVCFFCCPLFFVDVVFSLMFFHLMFLLNGRVVSFFYTWFISFPFVCVCVTSLGIFASALPFISYGFALFPDPSKTTRYFMQPVFPLTFLQNLGCFFSWHGRVAQRPLDAIPPLPSFF